MVAGVAREPDSVLAVAEKAGPGIGAAKAGDRVGISAGAGAVPGSCMTVRMKPRQ